MEIKISDIMRELSAHDLDVDYRGDKDRAITGFSSLNNPKANTITWIKHVSEEALENVDGVEDMLVVCNRSELCAGGKNSDHSYIFCEHPKEVFFTVLESFFEREEQTGIMPSAVVEAEHVGRGCTIGNNTYVGQDVVIEDNVWIGHNVTVFNRVHIGANTRINSGTVIGTDGFGYFKDKDGISEKVRHFGGVTIGHDVEIGANTCIDRGTIDDTVIGNYVKIDNLCHIAHNVVIGDKSKVIALSMLGGSAELDESAYVAPGCMVKNQARIGANSVIGMAAVVLKDIDADTVAIGMPAKPMRKVTEEDKQL